MAPSRLRARAAPARRARSAHSGGLTLYAAHFGLTEAPFAITPDPRFLYMSERHREALAHLLYGIGEGGGFVQLTGEVGTGKTTLGRCLLEQLPSHVDVALILNPRLTSAELLATVCDELGIAYPAGTQSLKPLVDLLYRHLLDAHGRGRRTVLIIDEAQNLAPEVLEQIRLLTNLETAKEKLLQIILIGQPELGRLLERPGLRQLAQRVTARYHLAPLSKEETLAYVRHRLAVAGLRGTVFSDAALRRVYRASRGVPRLINVICDRALLGAYAGDMRRADAATVGRAAREVLGGTPRTPVRWLAWAATAAVVLAVTVAGALLLARERLAPPPGIVGSVASGGAAVAGRTGPGTTRLADVLADPSVSSDKRSAFLSLYARWHVDPRERRGTPDCGRERVQGLACLAKTGTWTTLRRFDLPGILELTTPTGEKRYVTVLALGREHATLEVGGRQLTVPLGEIDPFWDGSFILLWKAPALAENLIAPGMRGPDVEWLRHRLAEVEGEPPAAPGRQGTPGDGRLFDETLRRRVVAFQRSRSLVTDGLVGEETLAHLSAAVADPGRPGLSRPSPRAE